MERPTGTLGNAPWMNVGRSAGRAAIYAAIVIVAVFPPAYMIYWLLSDTTTASSATVEEKPAAAAEAIEAPEAPPALTPPSAALLSSALEAIWTESEADGVSFGDERKSMRDALRASFPQPPTSVEIIYSPEPNKAGFFTIKARDSSGGERLVAVRLLPRPNEAKPWKVDQLVVVGAQQLNKKK